MIVSIVYTTIAAITLIVLALIWREFYLDRQSYGSGNTSGGIMATLLVVVMGALVVTDAAEVVAGFGAIVKIGLLLWLLVLAPIVKLIAAAWILRLRRRTLAAVRREREK